MAEPARPEMPTPGPRAALVTGAARRLGREIALHLARAGWDVAVHYRGSAADAQATVRDIQALGRRAVALDADLAVEPQALALVPRAVAALGRLDAVVNSASLFQHDTVEDFSYAHLQAHLLPNAAAPIVLARALHQHLGTRAEPSEGSGARGASSEGSGTRAAGQGPAGCVVNLLDQKLWNPNPDFLSYTLSKAALHAATTLLAQQLAPRLRVVGVAPGLTLTSHMLSDDQFAALHRLSPLGRSSTPADVCATVAFALDNASITGTTLLVDGGQHLMRFERDFSLMPAQGRPAGDGDHDGAGQTGAPR